MTRSVSVQERRRQLVRRHHLDGGAPGPLEVTRDLLALHATDPASVYLSVLARSAGATLSDIAQAMYERRDLVRWMAMRRTLFVFDRADIPMVQAAVSTPLAATLRRRLATQLERNPTEPPITGTTATWMADAETRVAHALRARETATGAQLSADVPALRTVIPAGSPSDRDHPVTTPLLTLMSAEGRIVRSTPTGAWTTRNHRWEPIERWWPDGLPTLGVDEAQALFARRWLERFGPATFEDLQWWMGWTKGVTSRALGALQIEEVDLHGEPGIGLAGDATLDAAADASVATLLPALDPTSMGWKRREWYVSIEPVEVFDRAGNIGPTIWWNGEIIGVWATATSGGIRTAVRVDRGSDAVAAIDLAAAAMEERLNGAVVTPAARTPLEVSLARGDLSEGGPRAAG